MRAAALILSFFICTTHAIQFPAPRNDTVLSPPTASKNVLKTRYQDASCCNENCDANVDFSDNRFDRHGLVFYSNQFGTEALRSLIFPAFEKEMILFHNEAVRKGIPVSHTIFQADDSVNSRLSNFVRKSNRFATAEVFLPQRTAVAEPSGVAVNLGLSIEKYEMSVVNSPAFFSLSGLCHGSAELATQLHSQRWALRTTHSSDGSVSNTTVIKRPSGFKDVIGQRLRLKQDWSFTFSKTPFALAGVHPVITGNQACSEPLQLLWEYVDYAAILPKTIEEMDAQTPNASNFKFAACPNINDELLTLADTKATGFVQFCGPNGNQTTVGRQAVCFALFNCGIARYPGSSLNDDDRIIKNTTSDGWFKFFEDEPLPCTAYTNLFSFYRDNQASFGSLPEVLKDTYSAQVPDAPTKVDLDSYIFEFTYGTREKNLTDLVIVLGPGNKRTAESHENINKTGYLFEILPTGKLYEAFTAKNYSTTDRTDIGKLCNASCFKTNGEYDFGELSNILGLTLRASKTMYDDLPHFIVQPQALKPNDRNLYFFVIQTPSKAAEEMLQNFGTYNVLLDADNSVFTHKFRSFEGDKMTDFKPDDFESGTSYEIESELYAVVAESDGYSVLGGFDRDAVARLDNEMDQTCGSNVCRVVVLAEPLGGGLSAYGGKTTSSDRSLYEDLTGREKNVGLCEYAVKNNMLNFSLCVSYDTLHSSFKNKTTNNEQRGSYLGMRWIDNASPDFLKEIELTLGDSCAVTNMNMREFPMKNAEEWPTVSLGQADKMANQVSRWGEFEIGVEQSTPALTVENACSYDLFSFGPRMSKILLPNGTYTKCEKFTPCKNYASDATLAKLASRCDVCSDLKEFDESDPCGDAEIVTKVATLDDACFYERFSLGKKYKVLLKREAKECKEITTEDCGESGYETLLSRCGTCKDHFGSADPCVG